MVYRVKNGFVVRKIGEYVMAVPVGAQTSEMHGMIALSESGELLWGALEKGATVEELTEILIENYDVETSVATEDVEKFIGSLKEQGALE
ncbi:MAG: PqqD family protein [Clostridia bacterium]|nr:PqqD family protein [Clostridia bacterium]